MKNLLDRIAKTFVEKLIERIGLGGVRIAVVNARPGDLIIVKTDLEISKEGYEDVKRRLEEAFPDNKILVTNFELAVIHAPEKQVKRQT